MTETLVEFLDRRERELLAELPPVEAQVEAIRAELVAVRTARSSISKPVTAVLGTVHFETVEERIQFNDVSNVAELIPPSGLEALRETMSVFTDDDSHRTIKQLVVMSLEQHMPFRRYGATTAELRKHIKAEYDKDIEVTSLSPQLSRLREDGVVEFVDGKWKRGMRPLLGKAPPSPSHSLFRKKSE